jgi:hypothetical protein
MPYRTPGATTTVDKFCFGALNTNYKGNATTIKSDTSHNALACAI